MVGDVSYDTVLVAVIVAVVGPTLLAWQSERRRQHERSEAKADRDEAKLAIAQVATEAATVAAEAKTAASHAATAATNAATAAEAVMTQAETAAALLEARQDAEEERQKIVAQQAAEAAALLVESNHRSQERDAKMDAKLDKIGLSGDGTLTAALKAQLLALRNLEISERRTVDDRVARGGEATVETLNVLSATAAQITALEEEITDREAAQAAVTGQVPVVGK